MMNNNNISNNRKEKFSLLDTITFEVPIWLVISYLLYALPSFYTGLRFLIKDIMWLIN